MRMAVRRGDRDTAGEIEVASAVGGDQPGAFAPLENDIGLGIGLHQRFLAGHGVGSLLEQLRNMRERAPNIRPPTFKVNPTEEVQAFSR
jgi:hypothetical protein